MLVEVRLLRFRGCRIAWREIEGGRGYRGDLRTVCGSGSDRPVAAHLVKADGLCTRLLPDLYEPAFLGTGADVFHLRGIERLELDDGVYGVVQEWRYMPVR
jgi:hypothetical protein